METQTTPGNIILSIDPGLRNMCFLIIERDSKIPLLSAPVDKKTKFILANP